MFKFKPDNVFRKINKMDRKQAYTWGAVGIVCFVALMMFATLLTAPEDVSMEDLNVAGHDLAQLPFSNDEAEEFLLASKYPDMQENQTSLLYTPEEKAARQEQDLAEALEGSAAEETAAAAAGTSSGTSARNGRSQRGYRGRGGGTTTPTKINQMGTASMGRASGSGINATYGGVRGDFSPYKNQYKGKETPATTGPVKTQDARKSLFQIAQGSRAAAGLKEGKLANAKRAMMGGEIKGSEAFTDRGLDLTKAAGLEIDTGAPVEADVSGLEKAINDAQKASEKKENKDKQTLGQKLLETALTGLVNMGVNLVGNVLESTVDALFANGRATRESHAWAEQYLDGLNGTDVKNLSASDAKFLNDQGFIQDGKVVLPSDRKSLYKDFRDTPIYRLHKRGIYNEHLGETINLGATNKNCYSDCSKNCTTNECYNNCHTRCS